jgi:hypothetical protein
LVVYWCCWPTFCPWLYGGKDEKLVWWYMGVHLPSFHPWLFGGEGEKAGLLSSMIEGARKEVREKISNKK